MRPKKIWTQEEDDALRELYLDYTNKELAEACGVEKSTIAKRLTELGLSRSLSFFPIQGEKWRKVDAAPMYSVSTLGRVRNDKTNNLIRPVVSGEHYYHVNLTIVEGTSKRKLFNIHRLVAEAFLRRDEEVELFVNHKDGDKLNNTVENLEWVTPSQNTLHALATGLSKAIGETHGLAKYTNETIHAICRDLQAGKLTNAAITKKYGIKTKNLVSAIRCRTAWRHISCLYQW